MGCSCDWQRQAFTMDPPRAKAVREAFFRLFKDGLIYRGKRLVNWDPATQTALADDEALARRDRADADVQAAAAQHAREDRRVRADRGAGRAAHLGCEHDVARLQVGIQRAAEAGDEDG